MKKQIPLMILIAGIGVLIGLLLQKPSEQQSQAANSDTALDPTIPTKDTNTNTKSIPPDKIADIKSDIYELTALRELVQKEIAARKELETRLDDIQSRLNSIENAEPTSAAGETDQNSPITIRTNNRQGVSRPGWINTQALLDAGLDEVQANKIRDVYENVEMEKLYLRDRAIREGWIGDERYRKETEQLDSRLEALHAELNEKEYDAYLFATGRPNRVIIESTLRTSPARDAGIRDGDSVIRYNNIRVFTWADLRDATTKCQTDSVVEVELDRQGQRQRAYVPCGPLGVRLDNISTQP